MTTVQGSHSASAERTLCSQLSEIAAALDAGAELDHNTAWIDVLRGMCFENTDKYVDVKPQARHIRDVPVATLTTVLRYLCDVPSERGVDPSIRRNFAMCVAALSGHVAVVRYLCERGVDASAWSTHAIDAAAARGHLDVVSYLCMLPSGRGVAPSNSAISYAAANVMWMWCGTCVSCHGIEVWIHQHSTTMPSGKQRITVMWMWYGTYVSCRVEEWIHRRGTT